MSRLIRRVPLDFTHPSYRQRAEECGLPLRGFERQVADRPQPMFDQTFAEACDEYAAREAAWRNGTDSHFDPRFTWEEWAGEERPDDPRYHRPAWPEGAELGVQLYEAISEGTPVDGCPVFPDTDEGFTALCAWAAEHATTVGPLDGPYRASAEGWAEMLRPGGRGVQTVVDGLIVC